MTRQIDRFFLGIVLVLVSAGLLIFFSASLGLLARDIGSLSGLAGKQIGIGIIGGGAALFFLSRFPYKKFRDIAPYFFIGTLILAGLVFVPGIGFESGGAHRWIDLGFTTVQPSELLKLGFVLYLAAALSQAKNVREWNDGMLWYLLGLIPVVVLLVMQRDTGTLMVFFLTSLAMFYCAGMSLKQFLAICLMTLAGFVALVAYRPYVLDRITTFLNPGHDSLGSSYQIEQALIAVGSGGATGRGFGQSVQKFNYLPEPIGDSIFAVAAEEFGLVGSLVLISLFIIFALRGFKIGLAAPDQFSSLLVIGIVAHIVSQSMINISAMLGLIPLTGVPLMFVSHGGTALLIGLCEIGIVLNVSRYSHIK